eukprot:9145923-Prorocentrum_lima.AAC.1
MTSSLVGSEMCIRDSFSVVTHTRERAVLVPELVYLRAHLLLSGKQDAVSYTHLTLPTICSV